MELPFNYNSLKDDILRINEALKQDHDGVADYLENCGISSHGDQASVSQGTDGEGSENAAHSSTSQADRIQECLGYCRTLKQEIIDIIQKLDTLEEELSVKQSSLEESLATCPKYEIEQRRKIKYYKSINLFAAPYFRDTRKSIPSPNEDSIRKRLSNDVDAYTCPPRPWTAPEHNSLQQAVIENSRQMELEPLSFRRDYYKDKLQNGIITDEQSIEIKEKIENLEKAMQAVRDKTVDELLNSEKKLDWLRISTLMRDGNRTAEECERMWYNYLHPSINKKKWTQEEDDELRSVAAKHCYRDWESIASELKISKRTSIQCLQRYQSHLNPNMLKSAWSPEDDAELVRVVESCKIGDHIPWNQVSYHIRGRKRRQIVNRWTRSIAPGLKTGPWSTEEDAVLLAAVEKYGYQWAKIEELIPGRSSLSCRERFTNVLIPNVTVGNWTKEEDQLLIKLVRKYPKGNWTKIASHLPGRTSNTCLHRVSRIKRHHPDIFENDNADFNEDAVIEEVAVPTHNCRMLNSYREAVRNTARTSLIKTMMKVKGYKTEEEAKEALAREKTSRSLLLALSQQLLVEGDQHILLRKNPKKLRRNKLKFRKQKIKNLKLKPKQGRKINILEIEADSEDDGTELFGNNSEDDDHEFCESENSSDSKHVVTVEELETEAKLDFLFLPIVACGFQPLRRGGKARLSSQNALEHKLLESLLCKALHCETQDTDESDFENTTFKGIDYSASVSLMCSNVVICPSGGMPVLPPNRVTLEAFKYMIVNARQLSAISAVTPFQGIDFLSIITSDERLPLFCNSCYDQDESDVSQPSSVNITHLPADHSEKDTPLCNEPVDNELSTATCTECQRLNTMRSDYHHLKKFCLSVFFWPALLTDTRPSEQQRKQIIEDAPARASNTAVAKKCLRTKRKKKSGTDQTDQKTTSVARRSDQKKRKTQPPSETRRSLRHRRPRCP